MSRLTKTLASLTALLLPGIALAQSRSSPALATIVVAGAPLSVTKAADLGFPSAFPGQGAVNNNASAFWSVSTTTGVNLSITFTLPTALAGPGTSTIPFACGTTSAVHTFSSGGAAVTFNPNTGTSVTGITNASGTVTLGQMGATATNFCTATVAAGQAPGTYSANVVLTVAIT